MRHPVHHKFEFLVQAQIWTSRQSLFTILIFFLRRTMTYWFRKPLLLFMIFKNLFRWQNTSLSVTTHLEEATVNFVLNFAKLCYHLVKSGNIKISAVMQANHTLNFPDLGDVTIDQERAETFGLMTVSNDGPRLV